MICPECVGNRLERARRESVSRLCTALRTCIEAGVLNPQREATTTGDGATRRYRHMRKISACISKDTPVQECKRESNCGKGSGFSEDQYSSQSSVHSTGTALWQ